MPNEDQLDSMRFPPESHAMNAEAAATNSGLAEVKRRHALRSFSELTQRRQEASQSGYIVEGLLPARSIGILVGDSGIGKSPWLYMFGLCVAAEVPFLGLPTTRGEVLILDYENSPGDSEELVEHLRQHLGLDAVPESLTVWNANDCAPSFGQPTYTITDIITEWASSAESRVKLVIIDPLAAFNPDAEEKNSAATRMLATLRAMKRKYGLTFVLSHHRRKPPQDGHANLDDCQSPRGWFSDARGASALINGTDVCLGLDLPGIAHGLKNGRSPEELALVLRGFGRVRGEIGPLYLARTYDEDSKPLGYRKLVGAQLLFGDEQQRALAQLEPRFTTGQAKTAYGRGDQATSDWLQKCARLGLIRRVGRGQWEKTPDSGEGR